MTGQLGTYLSILGQIELGTPGTPGGLDYYYFSDVLTFTELLTPNHVTHVNYGDILIIVDRPTYNRTKLISFSDSFSFTDSLSGQLTYPMFDTLTFSDSFTYYISYKLQPDYLTFGDSFTANQTTKWSMADQLVLYETWVVEMFYRRLLTDSLTLTETLVGHESTPMSDSMNFIESWSGTDSKAFRDTLSLSDAIGYTRVINLPLSKDTLSLSDVLTKTMINSTGFSDSILFTDNNAIGYIWTDSLTDHLTFSELLVRQIVEKPLNDSMVFTDTFTNQHIGRGVWSDTLTFADAIADNHVTKHNPSDTLVLNDGFAVRVRGTANYGKGIYPTGSPPVPAGVLNITRTTILQGVSTSIVLPPAEFNDFVSNQSKVIMQRSMTGLFRSYVKKTARQKLNWRFIIPKYKADELKQFILNEVNNPLTVIDWEGTVWYLQLLSDSVDIIESGRWGGPVLGGDKNEVTLEFTGTKYV